MSSKIEAFDRLKDDLPSIVNGHGASVLPTLNIACCDQVCGWHPTVSSAICYDWRKEGQNMFAGTVSVMISAKRSIRMMAPNLDWL